MRTVPLLVLISVSLPWIVQAGPNEGGVLIVHANPALVYSAGADYCEPSGLTDCGAAEVSIACDSASTCIFHVLAAFPESASPRLKAVVFGVAWDSTRLSVPAFGPCGAGLFAVPDGSWPRSGTGVGLSWTQLTGRTETRHEDQGCAAAQLDGRRAARACHLRSDLSGPH